LARHEKRRDGLSFLWFLQVVLSFSCSVILRCDIGQLKKTVFTRTLQTLVGLFTRADSQSDYL
jgi:hypothetical protein